MKRFYSLMFAKSGTTRLPDFKSMTIDQLRNVAETCSVSKALWPQTKSEFIHCLTNVWCTQYNNCCKFECERCKMKGINLGTSTHTTCRECGIYVITYQNGFIHVDEGYESDNDSETERGYEHCSHNHYGAPAPPPPTAKQPTALLRRGPE